MKTIITTLFLSIFLFSACSLDTNPDYKLNATRTTEENYVYELVAWNEEELPTYKLDGVGFASTIYAFDCALNIWHLAGKEISDDRETVEQICQLANTINYNWWNLKRYEEIPEEIANLTIENSSEEGIKNKIAKYYRKYSSKISNVIDNLGLSSELPYLLVEQDGKTYKFYYSNINDEIQEITFFCFLYNDFNNSDAGYLSIHNIASVAEEAYDESIEVG